MQVLWISREKREGEKKKQSKNNNNVNDVFLAGGESEVGVPLEMDFTHWWNDLQALQWDVLVNNSHMWCVRVKGVIESYVYFGSLTHFLHHFLCVYFVLQLYKDFRDLWMCVCVCDQNLRRLWSCHHLCTTFSLVIKTIYWFSFKHVLIPTTRLSFCQIWFSVLYLFLSLLK